MGRRRGRRLRHAGTGTGRLLGIGVGETVERGVVVAIAIVVRDFRHAFEGRTGSDFDTIARIYRRGW